MRTKYTSDESRIEAKRKCNRLCMQKARQFRPLENKIRTVKASAKRRNLDFTLTKEDLIIPEKCPLLEIPLDLYGPLSDNTLSIDRIDSSKGYTPENIHIISYKANTMKSNASKEELLIFARNILKFYGEE